jgi:hypothetical protein
VLDPAPQGDRPRRLSSTGGSEAPGTRAGPGEGERPGGWRPASIAPRALAVLIAIAGAVYLLGLAPGGGSFTYEGPEAPAFEISWDELEEVEPGPYELLRLERTEDGELLQRLRILPLPAAFDAGYLLTFEGGGEPESSLAQLALLADEAGAAIEREHPGARVVLEGLGRLEIRGGREAYQLAFTAPAPEGGLLLGKLLLVPEDADASARGVAIEVVERTTDEAVIERAETAPATFFFNWPSPALLEDEAAVQTARGLEEPLRSFDFL